MLARSVFVLAGCASVNMARKETSDVFFHTQDDGGKQHKIETEAKFRPTRWRTS